MINNHQPAVIHQVTPLHEINTLILRAIETERASNRAQKEARRSEKLSLQEARKALEVKEALAADEAFRQEFQQMLANLNASTQLKCTDLAT